MSLSARERLSNPFRILPLNGHITTRRATFVRTARTKNAYRFFALPRPAPKRTGVIRDPANGYSIDVDVWRVPASEIGSLVALIPAPLGIGKVELDDGVWHCGFLCESFAVADAQEISELGNWREYLLTP